MKTKKALLSIVVVACLFYGCRPSKQSNNESINNDMKNQTSTLRLIYPQWQGGVVEHWMPDIPADDASRGYYLGSHLLQYLAPDSGQKTVEVPVSLDVNNRGVKHGINAYDAIVRQTRAALDILNKENPERIVTLGGDCAVSVVPFTYLFSKYPGDVAIVWIDAHPDVTLPGDEYEGYHAMALTACLGMGNKDIMDMLPDKADASKAIIVGLRSWDEGMRERQEELGIKGLAPEETATDSRAVVDWLKSTGATKVVIHFDLDVLDPAEIIAGVGIEPNGMKIAEAVRIINDVASEYDLVGLTVAEPMFRTMLKMKNMLNELPLLKD